MSTHRRIILLAHHGLGDLVMTVPLIRSLEASLGHDESLAILVKAPGVGRVLDALPPGPRTTVSCLQRGTKRGLLSQLRDLRRRARRWVLAPHATTGAGAALLVRAIGAERSIGPAGPWSRLGFGETVDLDARVHKTDYYYEFGRVAGRAAAVRPSLRLTPPEDRRDFVHHELRDLEIDRGLVTIAPGSGFVERHKRWAPERWRALASRLISQDGVSVLLLGSPEEEDLLDSIRPPAFGASRVRALASPDPLDALGALSLADVVLTGCNGAGHLGAAAGTPVVGLFGPTNPGHTGPAGVPVYALRAGLECSPCYRASFEDGCGKPVCMEAIGVDVVRAAALEALATAEPPPVPWCATTRACAPAEQSTGAAA